MVHCSCLSSFIFLLVVLFVDVALFEVCEGFVIGSGGCREFPPSVSTRRCPTRYGRVAALYSWKQQQRGNGELEEQQQRETATFERHRHHPGRVRPRLPVLAYRDDFVCINKPAGMSVHRGGGGGGGGGDNQHRHNKRTSTQQRAVNTTLKRQLSRKVYPVHRLDHRTSGALLFAFSSEMCGRLHSALRSTKSQKQYIALLRGDWKEQQQQQQVRQHDEGDSNDDKRFPTEVMIDQPLVVDGVTKDASTVFKYVASRPATCCRTSPGSATSSAVVAGGAFVNAACTLVLAEPRTGRKHQIRRHAAQGLNMPIIGDTQHGDSKANRYWRTRPCGGGSRSSLNRLALHCSHLQLHLPPKDEKGSPGKQVEETEVIDVVAPLSPELLEAFQQDERLKPLYEEALWRHPRLFAGDLIDFRGGTLGIKKDWQKQQVVPAVTGNLT